MSSDKTDDPRKPTQNGHIESFNGRFREEYLNQEWFLKLKEAKLLIEKWRTDYDTIRPHPSLNYRPILGQEKKIALLLGAPSIQLSLKRLLI